MKRQKDWERLLPEQGARKVRRASVFDENKKRLNRCQRKQMEEKFKKRAYVCSLVSKRRVWSTDL